MDSDSGDDETKITKLRTELKTMSFEELQKLKEDLGAKIYNETLFGAKTKKTSKRPVEFKRENKNRPREMSSKLPIKEKVKIAPTEKTVRDPRFDSMCGTFSQKAFDRSYQFLDGVRDKELGKLKRKLNNETDAEKQEKLKYLVQRMENQKRERLLNKEKSDKKRAEYKEKVQMMKDGKNPKFVKKSEQKVMDLVDQYNTLKGSGKLEKHISKHRKRHAQKDKKKMLDV